MLQITPHMRIVLAVEPVDFRKGIDGLAGICRRVLHVDPFAGTLFVFRNRTGTSLKLLGYDGQGFWLCQKRLSQGRFRWWPDKGDLQAQRLARTATAALERQPSQRSGRCDVEKN